MRLLRTLPWAMAPLVALGVVRVFSDASSASLFKAGLAALSVVVIVAARPRASGSLAASGVEVGVGALLASLVYAPLGAGWGGAVALFVLCVGVGVAAWGLAELGRALGAPTFSAFAVASFVLFTAMLGLYWADPSSQWVERRGRRAYRQAVLHVDPALALAYGAAGHDRLRAPTVYSDVPLASSVYDVPRARSTGAAWLLVGLVAGLTAWALGALGTRRRPSESQ